MNDVEKQLAKEKKRLDSITAPKELETRLRDVLNRTPSKGIKRKIPVWIPAAVIACFLLTAGYHYNAIAYYGKTLLGFDEVISGTIKELNEKGMGQIVEKKFTLADGTDLIINGMMTDANQLVMYYTLSNPKGIEEDVFRPSRITGFLTNSNVESGTSIMNKGQTEIKGTMSFEPVSPFAKKLTLHFWQNHRDGQVSEERIAFPYNPNKAMQTRMKQGINRTVKVDKGTITFKSITATPTMTMLEGTLNVENFNRVELALDGIELIANGKPVEIIGSGNQSALMGRTFDIRYDALPERLDSLKLVVKEFAGYKKLNEEISFASLNNKPTVLFGKELWVNHVAATSQGIEITIATDNDVMLDGVAIKTKDKLTPLSTTLNQKRDNRQNMKERTLLFETKAKPEYLLIKGMHYMKPYSYTIEIPVK